MIRLAVFPVVITFFNFFFFFFFNDTATTEIYTLSLHDALPILCGRSRNPSSRVSWNLPVLGAVNRDRSSGWRDRKSTRLNSSHQIISYAVFCLKKKKDLITLRFSLPPAMRGSPSILCSVRAQLM